MHTKGPWIIDQEMIAEKRNEIEVSCLRECIWIARVSNIGSVPGEANAALIASAPALLEAAKKALAEMSLMSAPRNSFTDAVDALDEAIAKATQEAPNATRS